MIEESKRLAEAVVRGSHDPEADLGVVVLRAPKICHPFELSNSAQAGERLARDASPLPPAARREQDRP
jgi:hypothetical protein